jgi:peroxiredoxin
MKKSLFILSIFSTLLFACGEEEFKDGNVTVNVSVKGVTSGMMVIERLPVGPKTIQLDTVPISEEGKVTFKINESSAGFYGVYLIDSKGEVKFIAEAGNTINIEADVKAMSASAKITGSDENLRLDSLTAFLIASKFYSDSLINVYEQAQAKNMHFDIHESTKEMLTVADRKRTQYVLSYIKKKPGQLTNLIALNSLNRDYFRDIYKTVEENVSTKYPNSEYVESLKSENAKFFPPGVGEKAPNFALPNEKGETKKLADYKGKYVLLDFWATWCKPCIQEIPYLAKAKAHFSDEKLEIISICVDKNTDVQKAIWKKTIAQHNADWTQLYEEGEMTLRNYKIKGFPTLILISPEGLIVERGNTLRGPNNINSISKFITNEE